MQRILGFFLSSDGDQEAQQNNGNTIICYLTHIFTHYDHGDDTDLTKVSYRNK